MKFLHRAPVVPLEMAMASELELKVLARLRAHEILIQHLVWLAFGKDANALRDYAARKKIHLARSVSKTAAQSYLETDGLRPVADWSLAHNRTTNVGGSGGGLRQLAKAASHY